MSEINYLCGEERMKHADDEHRFKWAYFWTFDGSNHLPIVCVDYRGRQGSVSRMERM